MQREGQLNASYETTQRRVKARLRVMDELIEGQITLMEAAAHFRTLDATLPCRSTYTHWLRTLQPGRSDEERLCNRVIEYVRRTLADRPDLADAVVRRLQAELKDHLKRHGFIELPRHVESAGCASPGRTY
jgi:hypothetical protein